MKAFWPRSLWLIALVLMYAPRTSAQSAIRYRADAPCPTEAEVFAQLAEALEADVDTVLGADNWIVDWVISHDSGEFVSRLWTRRGESSERTAANREVSSTDCQELIELGIVTLRMTLIGDLADPVAVEPEPPPAAQSAAEQQAIQSAEADEPSSAEVSLPATPENNLNITGHLMLEGGVGIGFWPDVTFSPALSGGIRLQSPLGTWHLDAGFRSTLGHHGERTVLGDNLRFEASSVQALLGLGYEWLNTPTFGIVTQALLQVGAAFARSNEGDWQVAEVAALGVRAQLIWHFAAPLYMSFVVYGLANVLQPQFVVLTPQPVGVVGVQPVDVGLNLGLGINL